MYMNLWSEALNLLLQSLVHDFIVVFDCCNVMDNHETGCIIMLLIWLLKYRKSP